MSAVKQDPIAQAFCAAVTSKPLDAILAYAEGMVAGVDVAACRDVEMSVPAEESGPIYTAATERAFGLAERARLAFLGGRPDLARSLLLQTRTMNETIGDALAAWLDEKAAIKAKTLPKDKRANSALVALLVNVAELRGVSPASVGVDDNGRTGR